MDTVLLPGTGFLELALAAAERTGAGAVQELTLQAPLIFADEGRAVQLQCTVSGSDEQGRCEFAIYSRAESVSDGGEPEDGQWTRHAGGILVREVQSVGGGRAAASVERSALPAGESWPPAGAQELDVEFLYDRLVEVGYHYGPAFQGLRRVWRKGDEIFAEVSLGDAQTPEASDFYLHPALSDSALHGWLLGTLDDLRATELRSLSVSRVCVFMDMKLPPCVCASARTMSED